MILKAVLLKCVRLESWGGMQDHQLLNCFPHHVLNYKMFLVPKDCAEFATWCGFFPKSWILFLKIQPFFNVLECPWQELSNDASQMPLSYQLFFFFKNRQIFSIFWLKVNISGSKIRTIFWHYSKLDLANVNYVLSVLSEEVKKCKEKKRTQA